MSATWPVCSPALEGYTGRGGKKMVEKQKWGVKRRKGDRRPRMIKADFPKFCLICTTCKLLVRTAYSTGRSWISSVHLADQILNLEASLPTTLQFRAKMPNMRKLVMVYSSTPSGESHQCADLTRVVRFINRPKLQCGVIPPISKLWEIRNQSSNVLAQLFCCSVRISYRLLLLHPFNGIFSSTT